MTVCIKTWLCWICYECIQFQYEKLAVVVHVLQTTQNLVISRCCFLERTAKKCTKNYNARAQLLFWSFKPFVWWRSRCRCRHGLRKVPISCVQRLSDYHSLTLISFLRGSWNSSKWSLLHFCKSCMPSRSCVLRFAIWILSLCSRLIQRLNVLAFTPCLYLTELWTL